MMNFDDVKGFLEKIEVPKSLSDVDIYRSETLFHMRSLWENYTETMDTFERLDDTSAIMGRSLREKSDLLLIENLATQFVLLNIFFGVYGDDNSDSAVLSSLSSIKEMFLPEEETSRELLNEEQREELKNIALNMKNIVGSAKNFKASEKMKEFDESD